MKIVFFIITLFLISKNICQPDNDEAENKRFKSMLENYEIEMANKPPAPEPNPQFLDYKNYIKTQIMNRAVLPQTRD